MPELPEVETARRTLERVLKGQTILEVEVAPDEIVLKGIAPEAIEAHLIGRTVTAIGRRGKTWWIEFNDKPWLAGHLGMAGWIREIGAESIRLREHGNAPFDDETGRPRFLKLWLKTKKGEVVMTDGRRLGRLWLSEGPDTDPKLTQLGPDVWKEPVSAKDLHKRLSRRNAPIKALLLDQALFAGVGNWIADEILYKAGIAPKRLGSSLSEKEIGRLLDALKEVLDIAVNAGADKSKFPEDWLFHARWGGKGGKDEWNGEQIIREQVGGRTTAWSPQRQK